MAILGIGKKKTDVKAKKADKAVEATKTAVPASDKKTGAYSHYIIKPRVTEKAGIVAETRNAYTFEVHRTSTKEKLVKAVKERFNVTPLKIAIVNLPAKKVFSRGKFGTVAGTKKAVVYLKKGDKIDFV